MPAAKNVTLISTAESEEIRLLSVSSDSLHVHPSFTKQVIPPKGTVSIAVIFLPRALGPVESTLIIQTSSGAFLYQVSGSGINNPYKVQPLIGAKLSPGAVYQPAIEVYNPHTEVLRIVEAFTSGGFLQLTSPQRGESSNFTPQEILPHQQRKIIDLNFGTQVLPGKYVGFINMKSDTNVNWIIPVEVTVVQGMYLSLTLVTVHRGNSCHTRRL